VLVLFLLAAGCAPAPVPEPVLPADIPAPVAAPEEKVHEWVAVGIHTPGELAHTFEQELVKVIEEASGGRIQIDLHPIGALVPPFETFDAVATGAIDLSLKAILWWGGKEPAMNILASLPGSFNHWYQIDFWYWWHGGIEIAREAYGRHNIYFVGPAAFGTPPFGSEIVMSNVPIHSIDDYKGLKVRSAGPGAKWFEGLGASIVSLPGPELSGALEKGVVDAAEWVGPTMNWGLGLHEVADYAIIPGLHASVTVNEFVVNMDSWNALSPDLQRIVELAAKEYSRMRAMHHEALDHEHLQKMKDFGVEIIQWTPEEIARGMEYSRGIWEGFAVDELSRRALDSQVQYLRMIGLIE
jgi:TRAP-type mannitol/chloroaromatic compound transport system substrate-binding protein